ncbi:MAG TPA: hypothetical protein VGM73_03965 [Candidatus Didemnitutus sp.]|jgi:hypothetical protein
MKAGRPKSHDQTNSPSDKGSAAQLASARRKAEDAKKVARLAKDELKSAKKAHKRARKLAKTARKAFKELKESLVASARRRRPKLHRPARVRHEKPATESAGPAEAAPIAVAAEIALTPTSAAESPLPAGSDPAV